jgi:hypothetical protein
MHDGRLLTLADTVEFFWRPAYELGDAMLLSGFVPHRTYVEQNMTLERTSSIFASSPRQCQTQFTNQIFAAVTSKW